MLAYKGEVVTGWHPFVDVKNLRKKKVTQALTMLADRLLHLTNTVDELQTEVKHRYVHTSTIVERKFENKRSNF